MDTKALSKFFDKNCIKKLIIIALPIAFQSLISSSLVLLDNLMVSRLGEMSLTAVGIAGQLFNIEWMVIMGFCTGCSTFLTQLWGIKDLARIKKVIGLSVVSCVFLGSIFFCIGFFFPVPVLSLFTDTLEAAILGSQYLKVAAINFIFVAILQPFSAALRATQQTKIPMYISIVAFACDAGFNYLLIFGKFGFPALGVKGAAIATVIARMVELSLILIVVFVKKNIISGKLKEYFSFNFNFVKRVYSNASITSLNEAMWSGAVVCTNAIYGHLGVTAYAAIQATATIMDLFQLACFSMGDGSLILIGEQIGKGNVKDGEKISKQILAFSGLISLGMMVLLILLNKPIISLFNLTELGRSYAMKLIIIRALFFPSNLQNGIIIAGIFRAGGDARFAAFTEMAFMWLMAVPAAALGVFLFKWPVYWVLLFVNFEGIAKQIVMYKRYFSGKWIKNMITDM